MDESTWINMFENELEDQGIPCVWSLYMEDNLQPQKGYLQYTQRTFARFLCSVCSRWWNSAQVHILFLIKWEGPFRCGTVRMQIFKQKCRRCNYADWESPDISKENIERVISNLVNKIQEKVYNNSNSTKSFLEPVVYSDDVEGPHDREHCEACKKKVCRYTAVCTDMKGSVVKCDIKEYGINLHSGAHQENIKQVKSNKIQMMVNKHNSVKPFLEPVVYSDDEEGPHDRKHCEPCNKKVCRYTAVCTDMKGSILNHGIREYGIIVFIVLIVIVILAVL